MCGTNRGIDPILGEPWKKLRALNPFLSRFDCVNPIAGDHSERQIGCAAGIRFGETRRGHEYRNIYLLDTNMDSRSKRLRPKRHDSNYQGSRSTQRVR